MKTRAIAASLAVALTFFGGSSAFAAPRHHQAPRVSAHGLRGSIDYTREYPAARYGHGQLVDLVGDEYSGLGFYPLPRQYREAATRYGRYRIATNAIRYAVASQAIETGYFFPAGDDYRFGVFNPNDGVGSPFFAGYYN
jgi:hypothetical protein